MYYMKTQIGIYAVATAQVEYVLIFIVPLDVRQAYRGFTNLVGNDYLDWIFIPSTNDYDRTLARMPRYKKTILFGDMRMTKERCDAGLA
jgi:hypothetical protein